MNTSLLIVERFGNVLPKVKKLAVCLSILVIQMKYNVFLRKGNYKLAVLYDSLERTVVYDITTKHRRIAKREKKYLLIIYQTYSIEYKNGVNSINATKYINLTKRSLSIP